MSNAANIGVDERIAPHNAEAERQLLGAILVNNDTFYRVSDFLDPDHFFVPPHRDIYEKISQLIKAEKTASPITLKTFYPADTKIADLSATQFLLRLAGDPVSAINVEDYARQIRDLAVRRNIIELSKATADSAYSMAVDVQPSSIIDQATTRLFEIRPHDVNSEGALGSAFLRIDEKIDATLSGTAAPIPKTGLPEIDEDLGDLQRTNLILLAARPGMGKTIAGVHIARRMARQGFGVGMFTLELSAEQWAARLIAAEAAMGHVELHYGKITSGRLDPEQLEAYRRFRDVAALLPIEVDDSSGLSVAQLETRARRMKSRFEREGIEFGGVIVDYIGFLAASDRYKGNKTQEVSEISAGLKGMAKRLDAPVIALSQLSRAVENRDNKRPVLSDLRDSGSLEQDADQVLFLYRPAYYDAKDPKIQSDEEFIAMAHARQNDLEWIIAKNRTGPTRSHTTYVDVGRSYVAARSHRS